MAAREINHKLRKAAIRSVQLDVEALRSRIDMVIESLDTIKNRLEALMEVENKEIT